MNSPAPCHPVAFYCIIYAYRIHPMNRILAFFRPCRKRMVFFVDIIHALTEQEAIATVTSQFWEDMLNESVKSNTREIPYQTHALGYCLPDNFYLDCYPIYKRQFQECWKDVLASMKSFHEMKDTFAKLGVKKTETQTGVTIRKR